MLLSYLLLYYEIKFKKLLENVSFSIATTMSRWQPDPDESLIISWPPGYKPVIMNYRFADPDPKEIFTHPQHW